MSHSIGLTLRLEMDGRELQRYPVTAGLTCDALHNFALAQSEEPDLYENLPTETFVHAQVLAIRPEGDVKLRLGGQTTSNVPIKGSGLVLIWDCILDPSLQIRVDAQTRLDGLVAGTQTL